MNECLATEWRDPVQVYRLKRARRCWIICAALLIALLAAGYWYLYIA